MSSSNEGIYLLPNSTFVFMETINAYLREAYIGRPGTGNLMQLIIQTFIEWSVKGSCLQFFFSSTFV